MLVFTCSRCQNYFADLRCLAFPNGIPEEILDGSNDHTKPLPNQDNDIVFLDLEDENELLFDKNTF